MFLSHRMQCWPPRRAWYHWAARWISHFPPVYHFYRKKNSWFKTSKTKQNRTQHCLDSLCNSAGPFLPSNWCMNHPQSTQGVRQLSVVSLTILQRLGQGFFNGGFQSYMGSQLDGGLPTLYHIILIQPPSGRHTCTLNIVQAATSGALANTAWNNLDCSLSAVHAKLPALVETQSFNCAKQRHLLLPSYHSLAWRQGTRAYLSSVVSESQVWSAAARIPAMNGFHKQSNSGLGFLK